MTRLSFFVSPIFAFGLWVLSTSNHPTTCLAFSSSSIPSGSLGLGESRSHSPTRSHRKSALTMSSSSSPSIAAVPTWEDLKGMASETPVGKALDRDLELRKEGKGGPHVHSKVRLFDTSSNSQPEFTLFRDHAGWCPYCQKTMLLIEAKEIPINIELVNMRSYGDKPRSFLSKVPNGMLPALEENRSGRVALDSAAIMEFLEDTYNSGDGYKRMVPSQKDQPEEYRRYKYLMGLERELFRWWCTLVFRPEDPPMGGNGNPASSLMGKLMGGIGGDSGGEDGDSYASPSMRGFLQCLESVDQQLRATKGPYFLDYADHPTMIDFVYASHVERMLASCAYWKGMDLRNPDEYPQLEGLRLWMDSLEKHEYYLAFKSDYYTHVKDIPPQYGPGYNGVSRRAKVRANQANIEGASSSWTLPLEDDEALQPLYRGIPLPRCVLDAAGITGDPDGSYHEASTGDSMREACQTMAAWKLCGNGPAIATFSARGGPKGASNMRKTFGAELADPYAKADDALVPAVEACLKIVGAAMLEGPPNAVPDEKYARALLEQAGDVSEGVASSLAYLRDRIGVPRDLPLAAARYLRAYLNWAIAELRQEA